MRKQVFAVSLGNFISCKSGLCVEFLYAHPEISLKNFYEITTIMPHCYYNHKKIRNKGRAKVRRDFNKHKGEIRDN